MTAELETTIEGTASEASTRQIEAPLHLSKKKKALFLLMIFTVFLLVLEGALWALGIPPDDPILQSTGGLIKPADNITGFDYTPGWNGYDAGARVNINSRGWRGAEFSDQKAPGTIRVLGLGDSFTFGKAVNDEDIWLTQLERLLNENTGNRYEALNSGHENMNTVSELEYFREEEMLKLEPDVVILGFTVHNDAQSSRNRKDFRAIKRRADWMMRLTESDWFKTGAEYSRIARILRGGAKWASNDRLNEIYMDLITRNYDEQSKSWLACREALIGLHEECRKQKVPLILAIFPVYTKDPDQTYKEYPQELHKIHDQLKSVLSGREGVFVVDLLDDLEKTDLTMHDIKVPVDGHPNRIWHEIVARRLQDTIASMELNQTQPLNVAK